MFGVPNDAKKGRWRSRGQDVRRQPLCGEARQDGSEHGEYGAGLLHQLAKQGLQLGEESGKLRPKIKGLEAGETTWEYDAESGLGSGPGV